MYEPIFLPHPFWFASEELLADVLRNEIKAVRQLLSKYPDLGDLFDDPAAMVPERKTCFMVLVHRKLVEIIDEAFVQRYVDSPSLGEEELKTLSDTGNLVKGDAPAWVREMNDVVERLPWHISAALPEPLRAEGFFPDDPTQVETIKAAAKALNSVDPIQALTRGVIDQQLQRLQQRWPAPKRKGRRKRDNRRVIRDRLIAEIDDVAETPGEFLRLMDERKIKPQPTWTDWPGSWVQGYKNPHLRELIHKDKSRALSRIRTGRRN